MAEIRTGTSQNVAKLQISRSLAHRSLPLPSGPSISVHVYVLGPLQASNALANLLFRRLFAENFYHRARVFAVVAVYP